MMKTYLLLLLSVFSVILVGCPSDDGTNTNTITFGSTAPPFVYVSNQGSNNVSAYTINGANGALAVVAGSPFGAGTTPNAVALSSNGQFLYVANGGSNNISAFTTNTTTGVLTAVAGSPFGAGTAPNALTVSPNGQFLFVANGGGNVSAYAITTGTGVLTPVANMSMRVFIGMTQALVSPGTFTVRSSSARNLSGVMPVRH